ncbi:MAG: hypothetical protein ACW981_07620 [Candidatus Hodarchaeales archaeon]|jgi:hypothetical protein
MNNSGVQLNKNEIIYQRMNNFKKKYKKQTIVVTTFWILFIIGITILFSVFLQLHDNPILNVIHSLVFSAVIVNWIYFFPFLCILFVITIRTKNRYFCFQLFPNIGLLIIITFVAFINIIEFKEDLITILFIFILLIIVALESYFLRLVIKGLKENKQPLYIWSLFQNSFELYGSTILSQQALFIQEEQNGYSQRPFFISYSEIDHYIHSLNEFHTRINDYIHFLSEKNELFGWDFKDNTIILYPRVLMGNFDLGLGIKYLWDLLYKIIRKNGLTTITINYSLQELSLRIAKEDYNLLNDVTYHLLGQLVLERFKNSITAFLTNDLERSYSILLPLKKMK